MVVDGTPERRPHERGAGLRLEESRTLAEAPQAVRDRLPLRIRAITPIMARLPQTKAYRLNRFSIGT